MLVLQQNQVLNVGFSLRETAELTGLSYEQVRYLTRDRDGFIQAIRDPHVKKSPKYLTFQQLVEARAIADLRDQNVSLQKIKKAKDYLAETNRTTEFRDKIFVIWDGELHLLNKQDMYVWLEQITGKKQGQYVIEGIVWGEIILDELNEQAKIIDIADWQNRRDYWLNQAS